MRKTVCHVLSFLCWPTSNNFFLTVWYWLFCSRFGQRNSTSVHSSLEKMMFIIAVMWDATKTAHKFSSDCISNEPPPHPKKKEKTCIYSATWTTLQWKSPNRSDKRPEKLDYCIKLVSKVTSRATGHEVSNFKYLALSLLTKDHKINQVTKNEFTLYIIGKQMQCWTWVTWMEKKRF